MVGYSLSNYTTKRPVSTLLIINAKRRPLIVAEIELGKVALQMLLADVVVDAHNPALQD